MPSPGGRRGGLLPTAAVGRLLDAPDVRGDRAGLPPEVVLRDETLMVTADWHVPHHDRRWALKMLGEASKHGARHLVIAGDFLSLDAFFRGGMSKKPTTTEFKAELRGAEAVIDAMLACFDRITWLRGNHEQRLFRMTQGEIDMELLRRMVAEGKGDRVQTTERDYVLARWGDPPDPARTWRITHGVGGSVSTATAAAVAKAEIYGCNVAQGHNHVWGMRQTRTGQWLGVDVGCMTDPEAHEYKVMDTRTYPQWTRGFCVLRNGRARLWGDGFSEFEQE